MDLIQKGIYEHYKGKRYEVLDLGIHTETQEPMVIYKALYEICRQLAALDLTVVLTSRLEKDGLEAVSKINKP